ncbi:MAG: pitrilysin family protein [Gemmatimonadaceae bacterium]|nr:pitrilysin family protein [Gemmatimonadaceae bacterium]
MTLPTHRTVFPNGFTLLVREDRAAPVVAIVTRVKAGYFDEPDSEIGIAHVLEHMYFKGTPTRGPGEIATATKEVGGWLNAHTIYDATTYITVLPSANWDRGLDIQFDAFANSLIDADELRRELEVIIQEAARKEDTPSAVTAETLYEVLHDTHRMRRWRIGREAGLRTFTREMVNGFYRNWYTPSNSILAIVGDVDADAVKAAVAERYGALPAHDPMPNHGPEEARWHGARYRALTGDVQQAHTTFGWRTVGPLHPDSAALDVAASVLSTGRASRLYRAVRDRGLAMSASAYHYTPTQLGVFAIGVVGADATIAAATATAWQVVRALQQQGPTSDELQRVKHVLRTRRLRSEESMEGQASEMVAWEALGGAEVGEEWWRAVDAVTAADVQRVLGTWCTDDTAAAVSYRPQDSAPLAADGPALVASWNAAHVEPLPMEVRAPAAGAAPESRLLAESRVGRVQVFRTHHGVPVLVRRKPGAKLVHMGCWVQGGASDEPLAQTGLTSLMMRTTLKGTMSRTAAQIAEDGERLGGSVSVSASKELLGWSISVPAEDALAAAALLADVVQHPSFPAEAVATERAQLLTELRARKDDMLRHPLAMARQALFGAHTYAIDALGTPESVEGLNADLVRAWHASSILGGEAVLGIVGDAEPEELAQQVAAAFDALRPSGRRSVVAPSLPTAPIEIIEARAKQQSAVAMLFPGPTRRDRSRYATSLMTGVASGLGGRFFESLRSRQSLAYSVFVSASTLREAGIISAYIACAPEREMEARAGLLAEFAAMRDALVSSEELERARTYAIGMQALRQESAGAQLGDMVDAWCLGDGLAELEDEVAQLRAVTADDVQAIVRTWCDPERRVEAIVRGVGKG